MKKPFLFNNLLIVFFFITLNISVVCGQSPDIVSNFKGIGIEPRSVPIKNSFEIRSEGGHLQGIQKLIYRKDEYFFLSGSSDLYAYYTIIKRADTGGMVISTNMILEKPFKHSGGFQIYDNLLAVGVEDNDLKTRSKVFIFQIDNPEKPPEKPLAIIERFGTSKRGTAGCVAINQVDDKVVVIVGDWDTINLDFYVIDRSLLGVDSTALILEYSLNSKKMDKTNWISPEWRSYQNINLLKDHKGQLLLAATTTSASGQDILDLYHVHSSDLKSYHLQKIYSRNFGSNDTTKFRWGAGLYVSSDQLQILATPEHIYEESTIHIYE